MKKQGVRKTRITTTGKKTPDVRKNSDLAKAEYEPEFTGKEIFKKTFVAQGSSSRRNRAATIERSDKYKNIEDGVIPYVSTQGINSNTNISVRDSVVLTQKAYYNFASFRNTIDIMTEFTVGKILLKGGNKKSRNFYKQYFKKIGLFSLQDRFFREYFRSGNCFVYPMNGTISSEDVANLTKIFELELSKSAEITIPVRYIIINPSEIEVIGASAFNNPDYQKVLNTYELSRLRTPRSKEDKEIYESLPQETKELIQRSKSGGGTLVYIPLSLEKVRAVFYKKQDYEPFSMPMGFPVLEDINWKSEMKKIDMAITRTAQQSILLVTMGESPKNGGNAVNQAHINKVKTFFENESVARVLVADYTTKASFVVPEIGNILNPQKYQQVNEDIREGLNNLIFGNGEKFANASAKIEVFIERLRHSREVFLEEFLIPEMRKIAETLNFKSVPTPKYKDIDIKDKLEFSRLYTRLLELGVLTPSETIEAIEDGKLPTPEESLESQKELKEYKDEGLYEPISGGPFTQKETLELKSKQISKQAGRPPGTKKKQSTKKISPIGASISAKMVIDNFKLFDELSTGVTKEYKKLQKINSLKNTDKENISAIAQLIGMNEEPKKWLDSIPQYTEEPIDKNIERVNNIISFAQEHKVDLGDALILYGSYK